MASQDEIQYLSDANGEPLGVFVPIDLWREIESERETAYLLNSEAMKRRLLEAKERQQGLSVEEVREKLEFDVAAIEDLAWWVQHDRRKTLRVLEIIQEIQRDPFVGKGKPEPLKHELAGCWSRRIDQEHRIVYHVREDKIRILACRYHY